MAPWRPEKTPDHLALIACTRGCESDNLREGRPSHDLRILPHEPSLVEARAKKEWSIDHGE